MNPISARNLLKSCLVLAFMVLTASANAQQDSDINSNWAGDPTKIKTEYVDIDFRTTEKLKSIDNASRTQKGIQVEDSDQRGMILSNEIMVPMDSVAPFLAVGSRWIKNGLGEESEKVHFQIRSSPDNQRWSEWMSVNRDEHLTTRQDTVVGRLQYLADSTRFIQLRIILTESQDPLTLESIQLSFTSPGATSSEKRNELKQKAARQNDREKSSVGDYPMPKYATRTDWECPDGQEPSGAVSLTNVTHQIIHHSAGTNSSADWPAIVRSIWDYHVNTNGWSDIGYNWLVDPDGVIYQGRGWVNGDDEVQGAHFCGTNSNTMGVALLGNFEETSPSPDALSNLEELLAWKSEKNNIDPASQDFHSSSGLNLHTISGHRDGCSTLCPGENLYVQLPQIRENVNAKVGEIDDAETDIALLSSYPNPFSESTTISFSIEAPGYVRITIWDITGRMVHKVSDQYYEADSHHETWNASGFASGTYFCRLEFEDQATIQKMVLLK